ncbi:MAG: putative transposase, partial [Afipia broomeae]
MPRINGFRHPREIIAYAVWAYHRFALSTADVEDLLAERGVIVSRETIRLWVNRFGAHFADCIRRDRPSAVGKWHLDEVVIPINGAKYWLWRAVDANGEVLDILVQKQRNAKAAKRFLRRLINRFSPPRVVITDKLRSYFKPIRDLAPNADHRAHKGLNNRIEGSHRLTRNREKIMGGSSRHGRRRDFSLPTTRSSQSSDPAATEFLPSHIAIPDQMRSICGPITRSKWTPDCRAQHLSLSTSNNLAMPSARFNGPCCYGAKTRSMRKCS